MSVELCLATHSSLSLYVCLSVSPAINIISSQFDEASHSYSSAPSSNKFFLFYEGFSHKSSASRQHAQLFFVLIVSRCSLPSDSMFRLVLDQFCDEIAKSIFFDVIVKSVFFKSHLPLQSHHFTFLVDSTQRLLRKLFLLLAQISPTCPRR